MVTPGRSSEDTGETRNRVERFSGTDTVNQRENQVKIIIAKVTDDSQRYACDNPGAALHQLCHRHPQQVGQRLPYRDPVGDLCASHRCSLQRHGYGHSEQRDRQLERGTLEATGYDMPVGVIDEGDLIGYASYSTTNLSYKVSNLASNTRHYYRVRAKNDDGEGPWSTVKSLLTSSPPPPPPPPPPPSPTHIWTWVSPAEYTGCGPSRKRRQECSNGHARHTKLVSASEPYEWGSWSNVGAAVIDYGSWSNVGSPRLISGVCKQRKERTWTRSQRQKSTNQCGGARFQTITTKGTQFDYDTVTETWGNWTDTGNTREHPVEPIVEKEQERFSSPCNRRQTQWVVVG